MKYYSYFFTRQDMSPEQQLVQTAHAALKLGVNSQRIFDDGKADSSVPHQVNENVNPDETYFTVIGVRDLPALQAVMRILTKFKYNYEVFHEPDLNGGEFTSIAVYPVEENQRDVLMAFNLLRIKG